jgi:hypothetical protein
VEDQETSLGFAARRWTKVLPDELHVVPPRVCVTLAPDGPRQLGHALKDRP